MYKYDDSGGIEPEAALPEAAEAAGSAAAVSITPAAGAAPGVAVPTTPGAALPTPGGPVPTTPSAAAVDIEHCCEYRCTVRANPTISHLHKTYDDLLGQIMVLEKHHGMLCSLLPNGSLAMCRKELSYGGVLVDGRDFGNWGYGVVMRSLFNAGLVDYDVCSDLLLGDVVEAMLHLGFNFHRNEGPFLRYAILFATICLTLERIETWTRSLGYWVDSRDMARLLA